MQLNNRHILFYVFTPAFPLGLTLQSTYQRQIFLRSKSKGAGITLSDFTDKRIFYFSMIILKVKSKVVNIRRGRKYTAKMTKVHSR